MAECCLGAVCARDPESAAVMIDTFVCLLLITAGSCTIRGYRGISAYTDRQTKTDWSGVWVFLLLLHTLAQVCAHRGLVTLWGRPCVVQDGFTCC